MLLSRILVSSCGLILLAGTPLIGCELCAIYAGSHGLDQQKNGWFSGAAEQFTSFGGLQLNGEDIPNTANQSIETSTTQFILGYNFNEHFSLQSNIPYIHRSFRRPNGALMDEGNASGLGDAVLVGKLLLLHRERENRSFTWNLLAGLKLPTGSTTQLYDETQRLSYLLATTGSTHGHTHGSDSAESAIHGFDLTLGSGSLDGRLGTSFHYQHDRFFFSGAAQYAINTEGDYGYRFANNLTWDGGPGYYLMRDATRTLALEAAFSGEHKGSDTYKDQPVDDTGFTAVYIGPKLSYTWKDRLAAHLGVDFPVSVTNSGLQTVPGPRVRAGFTWTFGGTSGPAVGSQTKVKSLGLDGSAPPIWLPAPDTRFYAGAEYLMWWVKDAPLSIPLVSGGPVETTHHGIIGAPVRKPADSTILYGAPQSPAQGGEDSQRFQNFSGTRFTFGYTMGADRRFALEASGFALQQQSAGYASRGDDTGHPILGIPVYNSIDYRIGGQRIFPGEDSLPFSLAEDPARARSDGLITGGIDIVNNLELWSGELNGVFTLHRTSSWEISGIVGVRYLELSESLQLTSVIAGLSKAYYGQFGVVQDGFSTKNRFYGGTLGLRGRYSTGRLSLDMSARIALGTVDQIQTIAGGYWSYNFRGPGVYDAGTQGVFAQTSNEGRFSSERFAAVPEAQIKIGYAITPRLRATIGYDFLYFSSVMRPGDNMNRNLPKGQTFNQADPTVSGTSPERLSRTTDFFAHGVSVGMEYRF